MIAGLLGPSGCGKSMTLKCIAGIVIPDKGKIILDDRVLFDSDKHINLKPQERKVAYLFQNYALFPTMTVRKNIYCGMHFLKDREKKKQKYEEAISLLHLEGLDGHKPSQLSAGQAQRVALARMIVGDPQLLLLDEPFSALDTHLKEKLQADVKELMGKLGKQAILVTHSQTEASRLCSRLCVIQKGSIIRQGKTDEVFSNPQYVACAHLFGYRNFSRFEKLSEGRIKLIPAGIELECSRPIPERYSIVSIPNDAIYPVGPIPVVTKDWMKEQDGNLLILYYGSDQKLWWKTPDKNLISISSISIELDACIFLEQQDER
ncbi:sulfate/molybdate ABC transporter ATP-binding protein [Pleomorphochaeta sp. DL1XJH-081]|uniref:sulfate/molybdate ABC transporter ATP-binding protein n=1 Tax=Pleomorphochaeta sp. DL1XJH-081 TaxID=3409690 RepID=UPI003BB4C582